MESEIFISVFLAIMASSFSVGFYTKYASVYENTLLVVQSKLTKPNSKSILSAFLLYSLAAGILLGLTLISKICLGGDIIEKFQVGGFSLAKWVALMAFMYFSHIATEAFARLEMSMSFYAIFFQINVVVIVIADILVNKTVVSALAYWGGGLVLVASIGTLVVSYIRTESNHRITTKTIVIAFLSALTCGIALFIDGEIGNKYIFQANYSLKNIENSLTPFLFYEFLTFFLPACIAFAALCFRLGFSDTIKTASAMLHMRVGRKSGFYMYGNSALFSVGQFVFSVFALTIPAERVLVASILSLTPLFNTIFDRKLKDPIIKKANCLFSILAAIGIVFIFISKK